MAEAINRAKLVEESRDMLMRNTLINQINEKGMEEILKEQTTKYQNKQDPIYQSTQQAVVNSDVDELTQRMARMEAHMINQYRPKRRNIVLVCKNCGRPEHSTQQCFTAQVTCYGCGQKGHVRPNCPEKWQFQSTNYIDADYNEYDYEDEYYYDDGEIYYTEDNIYDYDYDAFEAARKPKKVPRKAPYTRQMARERTSPDEFQQMQQFRQEEPVNEIYKEIEPKEY